MLKWILFWCFASLRNLVCSRRKPDMPIQTFINSYCRGKNFQPCLNEPFADRHSIIQILINPVWWQDSFNNNFEHLNTGILACHKHINYFYYLIVIINIICITILYIFFYSSFRFDVKEWICNWEIIGMFFAVL